MKIAIAATAAYAKVTGHAGRAKKWLVYETGSDGTFGIPARIEIPSDMVFHYFEFDRPHPLDGIEALITHSSGDGFRKKMKQRGIDVALTSETNPAKAITAYLAGTLPPPTPRPIGELVCKTIDRLTRKK